MINNNFNNDFFGWNGTISRKNYAINMLIVISLYIVLSMVNFQAFAPYVPFKFLLSIVVFMAELIKLVLVMCVLSLVYRRIADFAGTKPYQFQLNMKRLFVFLYVVPTLYLICVRYFFDIMPGLINILDMITFFALIPLAALASFVFCFIKGLR